MSIFRRFHSGSYSLFLFLLTITLINHSIAHSATAEPAQEEEPASLEQIQAEAVQRVDRHWFALPFMGMHLSLSAASMKQLPSKLISFVPTDWNPVLGHFTRARAASQEDKAQSAMALPENEWAESESSGLEIASKWSIAPQIRMPETVAVDRLSDLRNPLQVEDLENRIAEEDQILLDVEVAYQASDDLDISLSVENLSNEEVLEIVANPTQRRETGGRYVGLAFNYRF